jgi:cell wall-associated NlpC family hydrolase
MLAGTPALAAPVPSAPAPLDGSQLALGPQSSTDASLSPAVDAQTQAFRDALAARQARLEALKAQLDELDKELEIATEANNAAQDQLDQLRSQIATTQGDVAKAEEAARVQQDLLAKRAAEIYRRGDNSTIEIVLGSRSLPDFMSRLEFLGVIGKADADLASQLVAQRDSLKQTEVDLENQRQQAEALQFDLAARKREIELRIADRQAMLKNTEGDLLGALDTEAARRAQDEAAIYQAILAGAKGKGIDVTPGGIVETSLAYHGVPYLWGGATPAGLDCSGLVLYVFKQHGVDLPHYSGSQFQLGMKVEPSQIIAGDVVFFGSPVHHVGIYIGGGYFIHAPKTGDFVKITKLSDRSDLAGVRRYPWIKRAGTPIGMNELSPNVNHNAGVQGIYRPGSAAR